MKQETANGHKTFTNWNKQCESIYFHYELENGQFATQNFIIS